jgi:hypothetical protein
MIPHTGRQKGIEVLLSTWLAICVFVFIAYPGKVDFINSFVFSDWSTWTAHAIRVDFIKFTTDLVLALSGIFLFSLGCISLGLRIMNKWAIPSMTALTRGAVAFVTGEIILSLFFLTIISLSKISPLGTGTIVLIAFLSGVVPLWELLRGVGRFNFPKNLETSDKILMGLSLGVILLGVLLSSARLSYDSVTEYFSHAKLMAVSQNAEFFYYKDSFVVSSFHPGILFTALIQLFGDQSARLLSWVNGLSIAAIGWAIGKELGLTSRAQVKFLILLATSTAFIDLLGDGKIELISTAPILAALYFLVLSSRQPDKRFYTLTGLWLGFSIISRPYNIFLVTLFIILFFLVQIYTQARERKFDFLHFARPILWMLPPLLLLGAFHLFQNWIWLKSPIAPLTYARNLDSGDWQWQFDPAKLTLIRLLFPFVSTFINSPQSLGNVSPLFLGGLPLVVAGIVKGREHLSNELKLLSLIAFVLLLAWIFLFFTVVEIRYVFFVWIILFLLASACFDGQTAKLSPFLRQMTNLLTAGLLLFLALRTAIIALDTYSPLDKNGQGHCYDIDFCIFLDQINTSASIGDRVLVLNAFRYYLRPDLFACSAQAEEYPVLEALAGQNPTEFWVEAYRQGYRYLAYEKNFVEQHARFGKLPDPSAAPSWLHVIIISKSDKMTEVSYRLQAENPPFLPAKQCELDTNGIWNILSK